MIEQAVLAGGCFWGMEEIFRKIPGVTDTEVGYCGGKSSHPRYEEVCSGKTNHAEAILIHYDSEKLSYLELLKFFFRMHDPTTLNQQHNDRGTQYRSSIFYKDEIQKNIATGLIQEIEKNKYFSKPIVTQLEPLHIFYPAEDYHQNYLLHTPDGYNCHILKANFFKEES